MKRFLPAVLLLLPALTACRSSGPCYEARAQAEMGSRAAKFGLYQEAYFRFLKAVELDPSNAWYLNNLAVLAESRGRFEEAESLYEKALALAPQNKKIKANHEKFQAYLKDHAPQPPA